MWIRGVNVCWMREDDDGFVESDDVGNRCEDIGGF